MREHKLSFWTYKNNDANRGYFPTSIDVVNMEMNLIDFSEVEKNSEITICDLTGGEGDQLKAMHDFLMQKELKPISYYNEVTKERYGIALDKYRNVENFNLVNADFFNLKIKNSNSKKAFTIIRNNPPYTWMDWRGVNVRAEDIFFIRNSEFNTDEGIQIFELPIHQLVEDKNLIRKIFYRYENIYIFKFPEEEFKKFKQICVIGSKKRIYSNDISIAEAWRERLINGDILALDEVDAPVLKLTRNAIKNTLPITMYRDGKVTERSLTNGFNAVYADLLNEFSRDKNKEVNKNVDIPLIEQLPGHMALDIYSGQYDGLLGNVLVKGGVKKEVKTITEGDEEKTTTTEVELIFPFVEITSANGDTLIKEHKVEE